MEIGTRVRRSEPRESTGGVVLELDGDNALIGYDEGGQGWWPLNAISPEANPAPGQPAAPAP